MTTRSKADPVGGELLTADTVRLGVVVADRADAIERAGQVLVDVGAVAPAYVEAMHEREAAMSSYMGEGFALPHGTDASREHVNRAAVAFLQFAEPVVWDPDDDDEQAHAALAVAATSDEHVGVLAALAKILIDDDKAQRLRTTTNIDEVLTLLTPDTDDEQE